MPSTRCAPPRYTGYTDWNRLPIILTTQEACALLRVSDKTACALINEGKVQGNRVGREYRFVRDSLREYICQPADPGLWLVEPQRTLMLGAGKEEAI